MNHFIPGQLIHPRDDPGNCHLVIKADPSPTWDGAWWVTVLSTGADKPLDPMILSPKLWEALETSR